MFRGLKPQSHLVLGDAVIGMIAWIGSMQRATSWADSAVLKQIVAICAAAGHCTGLHCKLVVLSLLLANLVCVDVQEKRNRDVGLMVIDTSRPGWTILHADCNNPRIDAQQGEGQSLWDLLKVPDVVSLGVSCSRLIGTDVCAFEYVAPGLCSVVTGIERYAQNGITRFAQNGPQGLCS